MDGLWTCLGEPCPRLILSTSLSSREQFHTHSRFNNGLRICKRLNARSVSLDRNHHNALNSKSIKFNSISTSNSTIKIKEWLNTINHKWTQLVSAIAPKTDPARFDKHFSSLPRSRISSNPSNNLQIYPILYDYAREGKLYTILVSKSESVFRSSLILVFHTNIRLSLALHKF